MKRLSVLLLLSSLVWPAVAQAELNLPVERLNEKQEQKDKNQNIDLFQHQEMYDLKEERKQQEKEAYGVMFQQEQQNQQLETELFKSPLKVGTKDSKTTTANHAIIWYLLSLPLLGIGFSVWIYWREQ